jgi:hypothetical protein
MDLLFDPTYPLFNFPPYRPLKRVRDDVYERRMYSEELVGSRRRRGLTISPQQAADILTNKDKISADGSVNTHNDVNYTSPSLGEILIYDGLNWVNGPLLSGGVSPQQAADILTNKDKISADGSVNTHNDVNYISPSLGEILTFDGLNWVNGPLLPGGVQPQQASDILSNKGKIDANNSINTHIDVEVTNPIIGNILSWNGINWSNR